jgi:hypothetical protein
MDGWNRVWKKMKSKNSLTQLERNSWQINVKSASKACFNASFYSLATDVLPNTRVARMSPIKWPEVGKVAPHYLEHGIILLDEAAKLQAMARQKPIPINVISPFIDSLTEYVRKTREQPTMQELLMEIRNGFKETSDIHEKFTHQVRLGHYTTSWLATIELKLGQSIFGANCIYQPRNCHASITRIFSNLHAPKDGITPSRPRD